VSVAHAAVDRPAIEIVNRFHADRSAGFLREKGRLSGLATCESLVNGRIAEGVAASTRNPQSPASGAFAQAYPNASPLTT